jgi:hypothetical protein
MTDNHIPHENLIMEIEMIFPIWRKEIARIKALDQPTKADLLLTIKLQVAMQQAYITYRLLRDGIKREAAILPPQELRTMIDKYRNSQN